jgi:hypothetical protein
MPAPPHILTPCPPRGILTPSFPEKGLVSSSARPNLITAGTVTDPPSSQSLTRQGGPCFATMGIYKPIWLEFRSSPVITGAFVVTTPDADPFFWTARVKLFVEAPVATNLSAHVLVAGQEGREAALVDGAGEVDVEVRVASPRLWWCNGLGEPALYDAVAVIVAPDGSKVIPV